MNRIKLFLSFLIGLSPFLVHASHIVGGGLTYRHMANNTFEFRLDFYKDCSPSSFDFPYDPLRICIYSKTDHTPLDTIELRAVETRKLTYGNTDCLIGSINCVNKRVYSGTVELDPNKYMAPAGYYASWEICCRNYSIKNIVGADESGMVYYMEFPAITGPYAKQNSSPVFTKDPNNFLCTLSPFSYNFNVIDADGDSLVFCLTDPLRGTTSNANPNTGSTYIKSGPYQTTTWANGYGPSNYMDGNPDLSINMHTGTLSINPTQIGVYVFAVVCEEYRNGIKIGEVRKEMQYSVVICPVRNIPELHTIPKGPIIIAEADKLNCITVYADDMDNDSVYLDLLSVDPWIEQIGYTFSNNKGKGFTETVFCFMPSCDDPFEDTLSLAFIVRDNSCPEPLWDTVYLKVPINVPNQIDFKEKMPNVFTPNGDGKNDFFMIPSDFPIFCTLDFQIDIFNRWGAKIYQSKDVLFRWSGEGQPEGVYFYVMRFNKFSVQGNVTIIK